MKDLHQGKNIGIQLEMEYPYGPITHQAKMGYPYGQTWVSNRTPGYWTFNKIQ